jgi:proteasome alpha subunit
MPFYVSPEQVMQDKAEYARKGISRGKSSVTLEYAEGVLLMAENPSSLSKIGEIYDRIAFAGRRSGRSTTASPLRAWASSASSISSGRSAFATPT